MSGGDLFDYLPAPVDDAGAPVVCALMPNMMTACCRCTCGGCGACPCGNVCATQPTPRVTTEYRRVTCPDCLALGDLSRRARAAQSNQAAVTA